jgi:hypothetical protein
MISTPRRPLTLEANYRSNYPNPQNALPLSYPTVTFLFGLTYPFVTTFSHVLMQQCGLSTGSTGLTYLGLGLEIIFGTVITGKGSDVLYRMLKDKNEGREDPVCRLPPLVVSAPLVTVAFVWYAWSAQERVHWTVPIWRRCSLGWRGCLGL